MSIDTDTTDTTDLTGTTAELRQAAIDHLWQHNRDW